MLDDVRIVRLRGRNREKRTDGSQRSRESGTRGGHPLASFDFHAKATESLAFKKRTEEANRNSLW